MAHPQLSCFLILTIARLPDRVRNSELGTGPQDHFDESGAALVFTRGTLVPPECLNEIYKWFGVT